MNIVVICPHYEPDVAPTGVVMTSITEQLAARGHRLHVVTALPWYEHHRIEPDWRGCTVHHQDTDWGRITRVHPFPTDKTDVLARAVAFAGFTAISALAAVASRSGPDIVLSMSPPLTLGPAGWAVARARRVPFVFNIQDVFPDVAVEVGAITSPQVIAAAEWVERRTYHAADAVTVLSEDLRDNVVAKLAGADGPGGAGEREGEKVRVIPNFIDTDAIRPGPRENAYRREHDLVGRSVVMYAGNLGYSQSVDLVLDAAIAFEHDPSVVFVINGGGSARPALEARARGMQNVRFVDLQPKHRLGEVLAAADVHVVPLRTGLARASVPSKLYSILAAGRPIVASVDRGTEVARTVRAADAGIAVGPDDPEAFTKAIHQVLSSPSEAERWGRSGRRFVEGWVSPAAVARSYEELFAELIAHDRGRRRSRGAERAR